MTCDDGSPAIVQVSAMHNGTEMGIWSCSAGSTAFNNINNVTARSVELGDLNLCPASCTILCRKPN